MNRTPSWSRRRFLASLGIGSAAMPFVPYLNQQAEASSKIPRRLLLVFSPNGSIPGSFFPTGADTSFTIPERGILAPLAPFRDVMLVPKNLRRRFSSRGGDHERGIGCLFTGASLNSGNQAAGGGYPSAASIDQILGKMLPFETDFRTLEVGVQHDGPGARGDTMLHMCYAGANQPIAPENSPYRLFDRLAANTERSHKQVEILRRRRGSVLDYVKSDLDSLRSRIDRDDRLKLEAHLEGVRGLELRLQGNDQTTTGCLTKPDGTLDVRDNANFPAMVKLQSELVVSALACDRTRIATLQLSRAYSTVRHNWIGVGGEHHSVSHDSSSGGIQQNVDINRWYATQVAYLLRKMQEVPQAEGNLLDHSLVVWVSELANGAGHNPSPVCTVLAGRLGGRIRTGRFVDFGGNADWNQLLVTICQAMGTEINKVGDLGGSPGGLPGALV